MGTVENIHVEPTRMPAWRQRLMEIVGDILPHAPSREERAALEELEALEAGIPVEKLRAIKAKRGL